MSTPFSKLLGKRVLIPFPTLDNNNKIILTDEATKAQEEELLKKYMRIPVLQVGSEVDRVKEGDEIWIPARSLAPGRADALEIDGNKYYVINEVDIAAVY
jgi:co-chaperonin GroES (HSP10)